MPSWVISDFYGRVRPTVYQAKTNQVWLCERKVLHWLSMQGKNGPCPGATQLSPSQILTGAQDEQDGAARNLEAEISGSPVSGRHQSGSWESGGNGLHPKAIQVSH